MPSAINIADVDQVFYLYACQEYCGGAVDFKSFFGAVKAISWKVFANVTWTLFLWIWETGLKPEQR